MIIKPGLGAAITCCLIAAQALPGYATVTPATEGVTASAASGSSGKITFYLPMDRPEKAAKRMLRKVSDPHHRLYRHFLSRAQIRARYGAHPSDVTQVQHSAASAGMSASLDGTGVFMRVRGTVPQMQDWISGRIAQQTEALRPDTKTVQKLIASSATSGALPDSVAAVSRGFIPIFVKLKTYSAVRSLQAESEPLQPNLGTYVGGCRAAKKTDTYSFEQLFQAYGTDKLDRSRATGEVSRMAIIAAGSGYSSNALRQSARCFDTHGRTFKRYPVDGMVGALPEGDEGNLDTQVAQAVMPAGSTISVVESGGIPTWFLAWAQAFNLPKRPDAVSMSYGMCEPAFAQLGMTPPMVKVFDATLVRLGLAGTTSAASSGDDGSSGCMQTLQETQLAVEYPASSPFITGVGGSRLVLQPDNTRRSELVWHDVNRTMQIGGKTLPVPTSGGGGGNSILYGRPWWQNSVTTGESVRTVPDVAMHGSFGPGWAVWFTPAAAAAAIGVPEGGFFAVAGTSAASPFFASNTAVLAAIERRRSRPSFGHIAPALYELSLRGKSIYDITRGNNNLYDQTCCRAGVGYDRASGIGAPAFNVLTHRLPAPG